MAVTKNTAKAVAKPVAKAVATPAAKSAKVTKVEAAPAPEKTRVGRKELAAAIRESIAATGGAIPLKLAEVAVVAYEEAVATQLAAGHEVVLPGFGKFGVAHREAREGRNPKTGEALDIAARNVPSFKAGAKLKSAVNGGVEAEGEDD